MQAYLLHLLTTLLLNPQGYGSSSFVENALFGLIAAAVFFFVMREVYCWYFKINKRVELLESINAKLAAQAQNEPSTEEAEQQL